MQISETTYKKMPLHLQNLFNKLPNHGSDEVLAGFPANAGAAAPVHKRGSDKFRNSYGAFAGNVDEAGSTFHGDKGSAARFFYCAKASKKDRDEGLEGFATRQGDFTTCGLNDPKLREARGRDAAETTRANVHPTVKPTDLMRYLCRLVTPPGGVVLDPFTGSGSTGKAAMLEGFQFVGCELSPEYLEIARARIEAACTQADKASSPKPAQKPKPRPVAQGQNDLFEAAA